MQQTDENTNLIKFKAQLLKTYIMGMFPKSFCKVKENDLLEPKPWMIHTNKRVELNVTYLHGLFTDCYIVDKNSLNIELEDFVSSRFGIKVKNITRLVTFRNEVVKSIGLPSKLTLRCVSGALEICKKNIRITIDPSIVTFSFWPACDKYLKPFAHQRKDKTFTLKESYKIDESEKQIIAETFKTIEKLSLDVDSMIDTSISTLSLNVSTVINNVMNN